MGCVFPAYASKSVFTALKQELLWFSASELQVNGSSLQGRICVKKAQPSADGGITAGEALIGCRREEGKKALDRLKYFSIAAAF